MNSEIFWLIYFCCNAFRIYTIYLFFNVFFSESKYSKRREILCYVLFFVVNSTIYYFFKIPVFNLIVNITGFFLLTLNYNSSFRKRGIVIFILYLMMVSLEVALTYLFTSIYINVLIPNTLEYIYIPISTSLLLYIIANLFEKISDVRKNIKIPILYWIMLAGIPASSLYMLVLTQTKDIQMHSIAIAAILILFINFAVFYLYNSVIVELQNKMEKELLRQENLFYNKQIEQMESTLNSTRKIQHDIRNHWMAISAFAKSNNTTEIIEYMEEILPIALQSNQMVSTGNKGIDSILNYKSNEALQQNIEINIDTQIPENLNIASSDCIIILGNLLDNAIHATKELNTNKFIDVKLRYNRGQLYLSIINPFKKDIIVANNKIITSNTDKDSHGYGLENVESAVSKYNGLIEINHDNNIFNVSITLYVY